MQFLLAYWRLNSIRVCDYLGVIKSNKIVFNALISIHVFGFISVNITIVIALQTFLSKVEKFFFVNYQLVRLKTQFLDYSVKEIISAGRERVRESIWLDLIDATRPEKTKTTSSCLALSGEKISYRRAIILSSLNHSVAKKIGQIN